MRMNKEVNKSKLQRRYLKPSFPGKQYVENHQHITSLVRKIVINLNSNSIYRVSAQVVVSVQIVD